MVAKGTTSRTGHELSQHHHMNAGARRSDRRGPPSITTKANSYGWWPLCCSARFSPVLQSSGLLRGRRVVSGDRTQVVESEEHPPTEADSRDDEPDGPEGEKHQPVSITEPNEQLHDKSDGRNAEADRDEYGSGALLEFHVRHPSR